MNTFKRNICLTKYKYNGYDALYWGLVTGKTIDNNVVYYTGQTSTNANTAVLQILLEQTIDDIGVLNDVNDWTGETVDNTGVSVTFIGRSKIDEFRRYSKKDGDSDLYNPTSNSGFTQTIKTNNGLVNKLKSSTPNKNGGYQVLYDYVIGATDGDLLNTGIHYSDIGNGLSNISYNTSGLTSENSITSPFIKLDYLLGVIEQPKIKKDVFIDRGNNSMYDKTLILGDIRSLNDMEIYGNGILKIKNN